MSAYVMADSRRLRQGVVLAWLASGLQAVVAITLVTVILLVSAAALRETQVTTLFLERLGYGFVVVIGVVMAVAAVWRGIGKTDHRCHHAHHDHAHEPSSFGAPHKSERGGGSPLRQGLMVLAVGIRPCSGAVLVLGFARPSGCSSMASSPPSRWRSGPP